ncbi:hypothetical protein SCP_0300720 [Sparassis crispa]|uniref:Uncharacterized protein n=1 Tax=Sparassis crispa TaxID=139825 RepID=A0A401GDW7_9APHY|nr:hypothetical protein SCP_0300720 [Sparassis crispa]GBE80357.1 hypothetical protein SCP_0300720 [Sparassis crispa]
MTKKLTTIEFLKESQALKLLLGDLTPAIINSWQMAYECHFRKTQLADEIQVSTIASRIEDLHLAVWYNVYQGRLDAFAFENFTTEVCTTYLPHDWDSSIHDEAAVISCTIQALNDTKLHQQLHAGVNTHLKKKMNSPHHERECNNIILFSYWLLAVKDLDEELQEKDDLVSSAITDAIMKEHAKHINICPLANKVSISGNKRSATETAAGVFNKLQKITQDKCNILQKYQGCYKYHLPEQDHMSASCPNGFPNATTYTLISEANVVKCIKAASGKSNFYL